MANISTPGGFSTPHNTVAGSVSPTKAHGAEFFAVASGVQIPYVGRDETGVNASRLSTPFYPDESRLAPSSLAPTVTHLGILQHGEKSVSKDEPLARLTELFSQYHLVPEKSDKVISKSYLTKISSGLTFNLDVLQDRAPHTLPYDENKLSNSVFRTRNLLHGKAKASQQGPVGRHDPRGAVKRHPLCHFKGPRKLKPLKRAKTIPVTADEQSMIAKPKPKLGHTAFMESSLIQAASQNKWDEFVLACLSKSTAQWIIDEQSSGIDKERLKNFMEKRLKATEGQNATAINLHAAKPPQEEKVKKALTKTESKEKDQKSQQAIEINYTPSFTFPSAVGEKKFKTENIFQQELLAGAQPLPLKKAGDASHIVLDTNDKLKFQKQLQENYPQGSKVWYSGEVPSSKMSSRVLTDKKSKKLVKGLQRWKELPMVVQDDSYVPVMQDSNIDVKALSNAYKQKKKIREDSNVVRIVEEWRSKWFLERRWQKSGTDELIQAMRDINDHVRLAAVSACSKAAELRQMKTDEHHLGIMLEKSKGEPPAPLESTLEPELIDAIRKLLGDRNSQVRIAAAITLYSLNKPEEKAKDILLWAMDNGGPPEKWAATQCLALSGVITDKIIVELVNQLHADNAVRTEKAGTLLAELSQHSDVVQSLIAELLNSNSWKDRVTACRVIPKLKDGANKDMTHKLSYLMWNDWNKDVRSAAAQALGKTGNGKLVHDVLRERILNGNERIKVDALKKLSSLGVMTARLLPALRECFKSEYVSVRIEGAMAAGTLKVTDKEVIVGLLNLASDDKSWKVKAHAIKALGLVGVIDEKLVDVLLWAIRYEKVAAVRAEACNAVAVLGIKDARLLSVLQDRLVVESEELVKREAVLALESLGIEPTGDVEMVEAIRQEVKRLCRRDAIVAHILQEDQSQQYKSDYKRLFTTEAEQRTPSRMNSGAGKGTSRAISRATSDSSRGWDPILAGYHAREIMSRVPTPGELVMRRSYLPMDLNSASSENSDVVNTEDWDELSEYSESDEEPGPGQEVKRVKDGGERPKLGSEYETHRKEETNAEAVKRTNTVSEAKVTTPEETFDAPSTVRENEDDSEDFSDAESGRDDAELAELADETSEHNNNSPVPSDIDHSVGDDGKWGLSVTQSDNLTHSSQTGDY